MVDQIEYEERFTGFRSSENGSEMNNEQIVRDCIASVWTRGEVDRIPEFYTEDFYSNQPRPYLCFAGDTTTEWKGYEGVRQAVEDSHDAFPDYSETPEIVVAAGDMVAMRMINRGTHTGRAIGSFAPSGKSFESVDTMFVRMRDGKICEQWGLFDEFSAGIQLGLITAPEELLIVD